MKKVKRILCTIVTSFIFLNAISQPGKTTNREPDKWSGQVVWTKTSKSIGVKKWLTNGKQELHRWDLFFEFRVFASFVKNKGRITRIDVTSNWQKDSVVFSQPDNKYLVEENSTTRFCNSSEISGLEVEFDDQKKNYWIKFSTPAGKEHDDFLKLSNIFPGGFNSTVLENPGTDLTLPPTFSGQPVGSNTKTLSGQWDETIPAPNDPGGGEIITKATWSLKKICPPWNNALTQKNISTLDSRVQAAATRFIKRVNDELCIQLKVASAARSNDEQDEIYALGRTKPGTIRTRAKGGQSNHNKGAAIDVYMVNDDGSIDLENEVPPEVVDIARQEGFDWGGNWEGAKRDPPHFEMKLK